jgi:hypothetical protein
MTWPVRAVIGRDGVGKAAAPDRNVAENDDASGAEIAQRIDGRLEFDGIGDPERMQDDNVRSRIPEQADDLLVLGQAVVADIVSLDEARRGRT